MMMVDFVHLIFFIYQYECNQSLELFNKNSNRYDLSYFKMATISRWGMKAYAEPELPS